MTAVMLMNVFIVPKEREDEFLDHRKRTTEVFKRREGFIERTSTAIRG